ncbi:hypothetical protein SDC9_06499 [bioreactor metagenome]|uniref:Uncharacterized protein n=1 Tax=bioreactor metagenome TaxID=1076179 RepID=A0A644T274_9ZZZZ
MRVIAHREVAHQARLHALVLQVLQELAEAGQVDHLRRLGQPAGAARADFVDDRLQRLHRVLDEIGHGPDPHPGLHIHRAQDVEVIGLDPLQPRRLAPDLAEVAVRAEQRHRPGSADHRDLRIRVGGGEPVDRLVVARRIHEALPFATGVPDQVGEEAARVVVAQLGAVGEAAAEHRLAAAELDPVGAEEMAVHAGDDVFRQPALEVFEKIGKPLEHRVGRRGLAVLMILAREAALHVKPRPALGAPLDRLREQPVDLRGVRFGGRADRGAGAQEGGVEPVGLGPDLARDEAVRAAQELQVIVVEDVRLALIVELRQRQRAAFDAGGVKPGERLEIAFVGDPDALEEAVVHRPVRVFEDRAQRLPGQAPPLAAQMRHEPRGQAALDADPALEIDIAVEEPALLLPGKREAQGEALHVHPAHRPADLGGGDAFDEIGVRAGIEIGDQLLDRAQRQARARGKEDMAHLGVAGKHLLGPRLCRGDQGKGAPFALVALREGDGVEVGEAFAERGIILCRHPRVDVDHHRRAAFGPVARDLCRAVQRRVAHHHEPDRHRRPLTPSCPST